MDKVTLFIPDEGQRFFEGSLNGKNFRIKTGEPVEVPINIARIVMDSQRAIRFAKTAVDAFCSAGGKRLM